MRAIIKSAPEPGFEFTTDQPRVAPGPSDVLVQIHSASICGTDREIYDWTASGQAFGLTLPIVQGHEGSGTVIEVGSAVTGIDVGDRVAFESHVVCQACRQCRTGRAQYCPHTRILGMHLGGVFAEFATIPAHACFPLPEAISLECGALMESAGVAAHAMQRTDFKVAGATVLVSGLGPVGLAVGAMAVRLGAKAVFGSEVNTYRREFAESFGIRGIDPLQGDLRELAGVNGFDISFEASGARGTIPALIEAASIDGTVLTIAHPGEDIPIPVARDINKRGVTLKGLFGRRIWESWMLLADLQLDGIIDLERFVTHKVRLEDVDKAMALLRGEACKVLFQPSL
ncbi:alcohol dehydrogenase catalytic domain-containing protein [Actinomyces sp. MRS3W]|uniref:alcohol dehydrogenase catalytic domain-containing protein n=1 Tax=Actinomyces sp. MRS3W TaxID=2800796 RepID=UPI0028FDA7FE|nr:alcohol dehydrogenase catalytic domain-containing protein [Actinomyces sp. MRS3W]MDU0348438.1 alcohol dehydrogenase catalytic domain-containing protein [Actinomyces sp. MRS3W]